MFESGNFKRRKRMRRHSYRTGLYKEWMTGGGVYRPSYPGTLYMSGQAGDLRRGLSIIKLLNLKSREGYTQYREIDAFIKFRSSNPFIICRLPQRLRHALSVQLPQHTSAVPALLPPVPGESANANQRRLFRSRDYY